MSASTPADAGPISILSEAECWQRLASQHVGRIVTRVRDFVGIFPVNFVVDDGGVVIRTAEGNKLAELVISEDVVFEVDQVDDDSAWSLIVRGKARVLTTEAEVAHAETLGLRPLVPTVKRNFVRIEAEQISGRWFAFAEEPTGDPAHDHG